jgi:DNA-binding IscR family transcriptional regulator
VEEERCASSHDCSIRPVWLLLQRRIDEVLGGVRLSDLLLQESEVRERVGLTQPAMASGRLALPILQG